MDFEWDEAKRERNRVIESDPEAVLRALRTPPRHHAVGDATFNHTLQHRTAQRSNR